MTDILWNDLSEVVGTATERTHVATRGVRLSVPNSASWPNGYSRRFGQLLDLHGTLLAVVALFISALYVAAVRFSERPLPFAAPQ